MEEALHKDSQAHAVIRAPGKRQGWGLSGIRDRSRDGRSGLSGQAQPTAGEHRNPLCPLLSPERTMAL